MIFLVDLAGNVSVVSADFIRRTDDAELGRLLAWQTWCFSLDQAAMIARRRRQARRAK